MWDLESNRQCWMAHRAGWKPTFKGTDKQYIVIAWLSFSPKDLVDISVYHLEGGSLKINIDTSKDFSHLSDVETNSGRVAASGYLHWPTKDDDLTQNVVVYSIDNGDKIFSALRDINCLAANVIVLERDIILLRYYTEEEQKILALKF